MSASGTVVAPGFGLGEKVGRLLGIAGERARTTRGPEEATQFFLKAMYAKSPMTAQHSERVAGYAVAFALALDLPWAQVRHLERCGLLHDMGKIGVEESILAKPGALTSGEWESVRTHPELGVQIVGTCAALSEVLPVVAYHHERFDGTGYPHGIGGDQLPLDVRIISICDAYDSMTADRPYRSGMSVSEAVSRLLDGAGTQFDPELVKLFVAQVVPNLPGGAVKAS